MKKIGTISSAAGLIFLGVWMIINKNNYQLGQEIIKWWPTIIILLGIEILFHFNSDRGEKMGFNFLIVPIIIIYMFINVFQGIYSRIATLNIPWNFKDLVLITDDMDMRRYESLNIEKTLKPHGNKIYFEAESGRVNIYKSSDKNIKINSKVYVEKSSNVDNYKNYEVKEADGYRFNFKNENIKRVEIDLYLPDNQNISIDCNNLNFKSENTVRFSNVDIKCSNGNIKLTNAEEFNLNINNGSIKLGDVKNIKVDGDNCNLDIEGKSENLGIHFENGKIDIDNEFFKNINIDVHIGSVNIDTKEQDVSLKVELNGGAVKANGEKVINSGMERAYGKGTNPVSIKVNQGAVSFNNRE